LFKALLMLGRFPQLGVLIDDQRNRGGGDLPSSLDAVGAPLHRLASVPTSWQSIG
jgi:hypothetical protein